MDRAGIPFLSASELSRLIASREVPPVEATEAYLDRIDDVDFRFNAYLTVCRELALEQAREAESAIGRGDYLGPMHGVPVAVKDQFLVPRHQVYRRLSLSGGFRSRGGRYRRRQPKKIGCNPAG